MKKMFLKKIWISQGCKTPRGAVRCVLPAEVYNLSILKLLTY